MLNPVNLPTLLALAAAALASPALADIEPAHEIVVTAPLGRTTGDALSGSSVLTGTELTQSLKPTIGETLAHQPGVSSTAFGPNASRPILRGFQGDRVRILTDGIGSFDVSSTSVDHAVAINPITADRIEVLRGPSALLYGSSAIGGVVNVIDSRIPTRVPEGPVAATMIGTLASAADERALAGGIDAAVTRQIVLHFDASYGKTDDLRTGGHILAPGLRTAAPTALANLGPTLPNSSGRTWQVAGGAALITDGGNLGVSVTRYDSLYGVPVRYSLDPSVDAEQVRLDIRQWREDLRGEIVAGGDLIDRIKLRAGHASYRHDELEADGAIGTTFSSDSYEARLEAIQATHGTWKGATGAQLMVRNLDIVGDEKFLPRNETRQYGLFTLQQFDIGPARVEAGGRYEHSIVIASADPDIANPTIRRSFDAWSGSLGASLPLFSGWRGGLNLSRSERAPTAEELFANGPHAGTQAFELGDPGFGLERSWGIEATLHGHGTGYSLSAAAYYNRFSGYIYDTQVAQSVCEAAAPGRTVDFPCFRTTQGRARHYGFEVEATLDLARIGDYTIVADGLADYVHVQILDLGPAPRIPPLRLLGGIAAQSDRLDGRVEVEWSDSQTRVTGFETPTPGYTMVNASLAFRPFGPERRTSITLSANNIFDVVARRHASFLKDYAPLSGRDIRLSLRVAI